MMVLAFLKQATWWASWHRQLDVVWTTQTSSEPARPTQGKQSRNRRNETHQTFVVKLDEMEGIRMKGGRCVVPVGVRWRGQTKGSAVGESGGWRGG